MPIDSDVRRYAGNNKSAKFGTAMLSGPSYYSPRATLLDGLSGNPAAITGLKFWYDFTALGLADGASITSVTDLSASAWDLTPSVGTPTFKTNVQNGLGAANLDAGRNLRNTSVSVASPYSIMVCAMKSADTGTQNYWADAATDPFCNWSTTTLTVDPGTTLISITSASGTTFHWILHTFTAGATQAFLDAETVNTTGTSAAISTLTQLFLAGGGSQGGSTTDTYFLEMACWDHVLTAGEISANATYIENKYAVAIGA